MLTSLYIKNYALIKELQINWSEHFNIITGETGSGKSIILEALGLLLGNKADGQVGSNPDEKCVIEAFFKVKHFDISHFFEGLELEPSEELIIRRELLPNGRSRAFINDTPVLLQQLKEIGTHLIDIQSQNQILQLHTPQFQLEILDLLANNLNHLKQYQRYFLSYKEFLQKKNTLLKQKGLLHSQKEFNTFLLNELNDINLSDIQEHQLQEEHQTLANAQNIQIQLQKSLYLLDEGDVTIRSLWAELLQTIKPLQSINTNFQELQERLLQLNTELNEIYKDISRLYSNTYIDEEALFLVTKQLDELYRLYKKHTVNSVEELTQIQEGLAQQVYESETIDDALLQLEEELHNLETKITILADLMSQRRKDVIPKLQTDLIETLALLGMPMCQVQIQLQSRETLGSTGKDHIQFLFSANKGMPLQPLHKIASGGESSRLMLVIKFLIAHSTTLPTMIFDEIDTGTSGSIADKMGSILKKMSESMQIISITHLPQIASKGDLHFKVSKHESETVTETFIQHLTHQERIEEIAKMLSGETLSEVALKNASYLLEQAQEEL